MGRFNKIINVNDTLYECLGIMSIESADEKGTEYWKNWLGCDTILRNGNDWYFVRTIIKNLKTFREYLTIYILRRNERQMIKYSIV